MKHQLLLLMLVLFSFELQSQDLAKYHYQQGLKSYREKNYKLADSLFQLSFSEDPSVVRLIELAWVYKDDNNLCMSCRYLQKAVLLHDKVAYTLFEKQCRKTDTIFYDNVANPACQLLSITTHDTCGEESKQLFIKRDANKVIDYAFYFYVSNKFQIKNVSNFPDVEVNLPDLLFRNPQVQPVFPGGDDARLEFLWSHIKFPEESIKRGSSGIVYVSFIINTDGSISDARILRSVDKDIDNESLRVIRLMPNWTPGKVKGKNVRTQFILPMKYTLR